MNGRETLAKVLADAFEAQAGELRPVVDAKYDGTAATLDGTFDLLAVADAIVAAVHAEQDATIRRVFLERSTMLAGQRAGTMTCVKCGADVHRHNGAAWTGPMCDTGIGRIIRCGVHTC